MHYAGNKNLKCWVRYQYFNGAILNFFCFVERKKFYKVSKIILCEPESWGAILFSANQIRNYKTIIPCGICMVRSIIETKVVSWKGCLVFTMARSYFGPKSYLNMGWKWTAEILLSWTVAGSKLMTLCTPALSCNYSKHEELLDPMECFLNL